jgi:hypothetical protein
MSFRLELTYSREGEEKLRAARPIAREIPVRHLSLRYFAMLAETWELTEAAEQPNITAGQGRTLS